MAGGLLILSYLIINEEIGFIFAIKPHKGTKGAGGDLETF